MPINSLSPKFQIQKATREDLEVLFQFQTAMARESEDVALDPTALRMGLEAVLNSADKGTYFVALHANAIVGCLLVTLEWSDWRNGQVWWIQSVYVDPAQRRQGVYRSLYNYLREQASGDPSVVGIRLYVEKDNHRARTVYKNLGMNEDRYLVCEWLKTDH